MSPIETTSAKMIVIVTHSLFAYFYAVIKPTIIINDERYCRPWGKSIFEVPAGSYNVSVSFPWISIFPRESGNNLVKVDLKPGEVKKISYRASLVRYLPGKIIDE